MHDRAAQEPGPRPTQLLIVEDDAVTRRAMIRGARVGVEWIECGSLAEATGSIHSSREPISGAVVDIGLPDGCGLDLVPVLRTRNPGARVLIISGHRQPALPLRAYLLDAAFLMKPDVPAEALRKFAREAELADKQEWRVIEAVHRTAAAHRLTIRQVVLLERLAMRRSRSAIAKELGVSMNTMKGRIRVLLRRTGGHTCVDQLLASLENR